METKHQKDKMEKVCYLKIILGKTYPNIVVSKKIIYFIIIMTHIL